MLTFGLHVEDVEVGSTASALVLGQVGEDGFLPFYMFFRLIKVINLSAKLVQSTLLPVHAE